jgi:hypothetical protein
MRHPTALSFPTLLLSACALLGQQAGDAAAAQPKAGAVAVGGTQAAAKSDGLLEIYQIDLDPSGTAFALGKPVLEGDVYVFKVWPERETVRLPQSKVKKITQRTKNLDQEVVYQIDLVPSGRMIAREEPKLKGTTYTFHTWKAGTLMSLRQADIQKITRVTGVPAFKIQQEERGASLNGNLPMQGGTATILPGGPDTSSTQAPAAQPPPSGNWGYPAGVSEANPPPSAVVSSPGDVPKAAPAPTPQPR